MSDTKSKPTLVLTRGATMTLDSLTKMFKQLTGRDPTPEDLKAAEATLAKHKTK